MCLIVFAYEHHPDYKLIFAANRDELYERPTRPAQFWDTSPPILAGKDCSAGGTWLGINQRGEFGALTNYRDPSIQKEDPPSRGEIIPHFLTQKTNSKSFLKKLHKNSDRYMGFNVLLGSAEQLFHYSNQQKQINQIEPGIHGLSNHLLNTPWPKVIQAKRSLAELISADKFDEEHIFTFLQNDTPAPDGQLPDTGIPADLEKQVSPIFIKTDKYGTRNSTLLLIDNNGKVTFEERCYKPGTTRVKDKNRFEFLIDRS